MKRVAVLIALSLAACAKPEPVIRYQTVEVRVPVSVPCDPDIGPEPSYVMTPEAVAAAPNIYVLTVMLLSERIQRIARDEVKTAALDGCRAVPPELPPRPG